MADRARRFFTEAGELGGLVAKMRLASFAKISSTEAASAEDSQALLARLEEGLTRIRSEFAGRQQRTGAATGPEGAIVHTRAGADQTGVLRRHLQVYLDLMTQRSLFLGDWQATARRINEAAVDTLDIERVSVWLLDEGRTKITCADLHIRSTRAHVAGMELSSKDFPDYFAALQSERTIAAIDAHTDPRTSCFSEPYLTPLGIGAMLDVPIWVGGPMVGVVCHEHVGAQRPWTGDEENFAYLMANFMAMSLERTNREPAAPDRQDPVDSSDDVEPASVVL